MATLYWRGGADAVNQIATTQITADDAATTYTVTIGGATVSVTGSGTGVNDTAALLQTALAGESHPYFAAINWTVATDTITATASTAGVPFVFSTSDTGGTGTIGAYTVSTANSGPNDWGTANNWDTGAIPVNSDDVIIADGSVPIRWGLAQTGVSLTSLTIRKTYTGEIGLVYDEFATSSDGNTRTNGTYEYRELHLSIISTNVDIGQNFSPGSPAGSQMINLDTHTTASTIVVHDTANNGYSGRNAVNLLANNSSTAIHVRRSPGGVGVAAMEPGETSTVSSISFDARNIESKIQVSDGVTVTTYTQNGGTAYLQAAATITTATMNGGALWTTGNHVITTGNANGGTWNALHTSASVAFTTLNIQGGFITGLLSSEARTWTTVNWKRGDLETDPSAVTITTLNEGDSRPFRGSIVEV